ncbi:glycosyltransferase family 39 protein [Pseudonocardia hierapolitana]|uniref:glycosyltransferase family 39 protein n=1 Tax=Pseudonocardia hierapolitana TaxID=1128676 RepID=UPI001FE2F552|nr:glycosyltransferase family 39 protein [Pseudonocardia hierapolitana]
MTVEQQVPVRVLPAFSRGAVGAVAVAVGVVLTAVSGQYGYFGDELYFVAAGHHLDWGYADQPPLLPLIALLMDTIAPGSVAVLRIPATLAIVTAVVLAALLAREFGGARRAQLLAAGAVAVSPGFLATGHLLATSTLDPVAWIAVTYLLVRWVRTRSDGLLLAAGIVTAVGLQAKFLIVALWAVAIVAAWFCGPRELLRRRALWAGAGIAVLATIPTLVWQARNGWPQLEMGRVVAEESVYAGGMIGFLPLGFFASGLLVGSVLGVIGVVRLLRVPEHRFLGVTALGVALLFMVAGGRPYYIAGVLPLLWAAGAARVEQVRPAAWWRWTTTWPAYALTAGALLVVNVLPVQPASMHADQPLQIGNFQRDEIGWPAMVADVQAACRALPPDVARDAVVVTGDYWSYSAVQKFAPELPSFSFSRGAAWFGTPPEESGAVVFVGDPTAIIGAFRTGTWIGRLDNDERVANLAQGTPIYLLEGRRVPWAQLWESARRL